MPHVCAKPYSPNCRAQIGSPLATCPVGWSCGAVGTQVPADGDTVYDLEGESKDGDADMGRGHAGLEVGEEVGAVEVVDGLAFGVQSINRAASGSEFAKGGGRNRKIDVQKRKRKRQRRGEPLRPGDLT